ncbi:Pro-apoptotic serine protease [Phytophthora rubi]|uniref:Pro-apoptotic serine protease n=1 Tax=Phytophthora rubi TaxID=129364 RepID=A0A6A3N7T5_9STRA|nr:Pro-apoptotic serine protease [Phytophthora rubi]KAE9039694.1 Pro-apoptotic serine protease [Phytophthora rubi]
MEDQTHDEPMLQPCPTSDASSLQLNGFGVDAAATGESKRWLQSLEKSIRAIVSIRLLSVRAFDGNGASFSVATGFVVDIERGLILTNRHVVTPGPVVADAIFLNKEEVDLVPIYRDPVHDFGFFRFDPKKVKFLQLHEIPLRPEAAKIGAEIRVVGNDAGEKLSILPGILAKLDRDAPSYGSSTYNDFNTFYFAAASSTSGGSSGSPVLNIDGCAIALNAGGAKKSASSFYLPLDRVVRVLGLIQQGQPVPRGTIQTIFRHTAFDEVRRLGLSGDTEALVRQQFPQETGMLVVDQVVQGGPAHDKLRTGDVLIQFAGQYGATFLKIEEFLDSHVGETVEAQFQRGDEQYTTTLSIQDLHSITPDRYLEIGGGIVHALSYQQARNASLPVGGVYLAQAGHMFMKAHLAQPCIITSVAGQPTPTLDDFARVMASLPNGFRTVLRYFMIRDRHRVRTAFIMMDRLWFPMQMRTRNDDDGLWYSKAYTQDTTSGEKPSLVNTANSNPTFAPAPLSFPGGNALGKKTLLSLVMVSFDIPYMIDGISSSSYHGMGVVVDAEQGFVLVDQNTVPIALGDVLITIAATVEVPAKVVFVHPVHNFSIVQYDPKALGAVADHIESVALAEKPLEVGETADYIGLSSNWTVVTMKSVVTKLDRLVLRDFQPPRYKACNIEVLHFDRITKSVGGVFIDDAGAVNALWLSFSYQDSAGRKEVFRGLPVSIVRPIVDELRASRIPGSVNILPAQLLTYSLSKARSGLGLSDAWIQKLGSFYEDKRQVLGIKRCAAGTDCAEKLESGDLLLAIDGQVVVRDADVEGAVDGKTELKALLVRDQKEVEVTVSTSQLSAMGTDRVIVWCGLVIQSPHYAVASLGYIPEEGGGVYCSRWCYGSPAHKYGLRATIWLVEVNGEPTRTLDDFLRVVERLGNRESVRLKTISINTKPKVFTLKTDYHYWPTIELRRDGWDWKYAEHPVIA